MFHVLVCLMALLRLCLTRSYELEVSVGLIDPGSPLWTSTGHPKRCVVGIASLQMAAFVWLLYFEWFWLWSEYRVMLSWVCYGFPWSWGNSDQVTSRDEIGQVSISNRLGRIAAPRHPWCSWQSSLSSRSCPPSQPHPSLLLCSSPTACFQSFTPFHFGALIPAVPLSGILFLPFTTKLDCDPFFVWFQWCFLGETSHDPHVRSHMLVIGSHGAWYHP